MGISSAALFQEYLPFYIYQKAPIFLLGYIAVTVALYLYFSKEVIPYTGKEYQDQEDTPVFHHVGVYAYRPDALAAYPSWTTGPLEQLEGLEQLRFLENRRAVLCVEVSAKGRHFWELNNPADVSKLEQMMLQMGMQ